MSITDQKRDPEPNLTARPARVVDTPYLNAEEAVIYLRLPSIRALYRLILEQRLPHGRRGRIYLFDKRKLDRWVDSCGVCEMVEVVSRRRA